LSFLIPHYSLTSYLPASIHHLAVLILIHFSSIFDFTILKLIAMKATFLFLQGVGFQEILLIGLFVLVFFGAKKIPEFMKGLGKGVREFKDSVKDVKKEVEDANNSAKLED
jgi:sec-independent protein translocase protein TatA